MLTVHKLKIDQDLSERGVIHACSLLGCLPDDSMTLVCSFECMEHGMFISKKHKMNLTLLPKELLANDGNGNGGDTWGVGWRDSWVWSTGV